MKIFGERSDITQALKLLEIENFVYIEGLFPKVLIPHNETQSNADRKILLERQIRELEIEHCLVVIEDGYITLKDTEVFEKKLDAWSEQEIKKVNRKRYPEKAENIKEVSKKIKKALHSHHRKVNLSCLQLKQIPEAIGFLSELKALNCCHNPLIEIPANLNHLERLEELFLSDTALTSFPLEICQIENLKILHLSNNEISTIPPEIQSLKNLQIFKCTNNDLKHLPSEIGALTQLRTLDFSNNQIVSIPKEIRTLTSLEELNLKLNKLSQLPDHLTNAKKLRSISLSYNKLRCIPRFFKEFKELSYLSISDNQLTEIPDELTELTQINELVLSTNKISSLPREFFKLCNLTQLNVSNNQLSFLPKNMHLLTRLKRADFSNNQLLYLPDDLGKIESLDLLNISFNERLSSLPFSLGLYCGRANLSILGTQIPKRQKKALEQISNPNRQSLDIEDLNIKSDLLKSYLSEDFDFSFENAFDQKTLFLINHWLDKLMATKEFKLHPGGISRFIYDLRVELEEKSSLSGEFFKRLELSNNDEKTHEIVKLQSLYLFWQLENQLKQRSIKEKLEFALGIAKTNALREGLEQQIDQREQEKAALLIQQKIPEEEAYARAKIQERTELQLFYENEFRHELHLITLFQHEHYDQFVLRDWIDRSSLKSFIYKHTYKFLSRMNSIKDLAHQNSTFQAILSKQNHICRTNNENASPLEIENKALYRWVKLEVEI